MECASPQNTATHRASLLSMSDQVQHMKEMPSLIVAGLKSFLNVECLYLAAYIVVLSGDLPVATKGRTTASFIVGCYTLMLIERVAVREIV